jgi:hypothetical protein
LNSIQLAIFLWMQLEEAVSDLPDMSVAGAFERFVGWTRQRHITP